MQLRSTVSDSKRFKMDPPESEAEVRQLRANIYGECTENNWVYCKEKWMMPENIQWLKEHQPKSNADSSVRN